MFTNTIGFLHNLEGQVIQILQVTVVANYLNHRQSKLFNKSPSEQII